MKLICLVISLIILNSCVHQSFDPKEADPNFKSHAHAPLITCPPQKQNFELIKEFKAEDYTIKTYEAKDSYYTLPKEDKTHTLTVEVFQPNHVKTPTPVLVLPISGGDYFFARYFSRGFASNGMQAVFIHRQKKYLKFNDLEQIEPNLKQLVIDHKLVIDWLETQKHLNFSQLSCFGISLGGIKSILVSGNDPRVKNTVAYLAGARLPEIITYSNEKGVVKRRNYLLKKHQISSEELLTKLKDIIKTDPLYYARNIDPKNTFILTAKYDKAVPYENGLDLYDALGKPEHLSIYTGHYSAVSLLPYLRWKAISFLKEKIEKK